MFCHPLLIRPSFPDCLFSASDPSLNLAGFLFGFRRDFQIRIVRRKVNSQSKRDDAETVAANVPNVKQVVNDLQVKDQKASSFTIAGQSPVEWGAAAFRAALMLIGLLP